MESHRFDTLVKVLAARQPRRAAFALLAVLGLGLPEGQAKGDGPVRSQADRNRRTRQFQCKPAGVKCIHNPPKRKKPRTGKLCRKCCETFRKLDQKVGLCCIPNGQRCSSAAECCLGSCSVGTCQNTTVQFPPPTTPLPTTPPPGTPCVAFAQACSSAAECCPTQTGTPVPCSGGLCRFN